MKKYLLSCLATAIALIANAGIQFPNVFEKNFDLSPSLEGWTIYAPEGRPSGQFGPQILPDYSPSNAVAIAYGDNLSAVWTMSQYSNGQESDTWVITPEITVTNDTELLSFTVQVIGMGSSVINNYAVYVSEGGVEKEDFQLFKAGTIKGSAGGAGYFQTTNQRLAMTGYAGKKIRLAFVNSGNKVGIMGFGNLALGSWYAQNYPASKIFDSLLMTDGENLSFPITLSTPVTARTFDIDFKTSGGFSYSETVDKRLSINSLINYTVLIPQIKISDSESFTLTITPEFEGVEPMVITGYLVKGSREYEYVGVLEEATGTWCGWCPYGAAALSFYSHLYNGENGAHKAIPIAIHGGYDSDPMEIPAAVSDYYMEWMLNEGSGGYPAVAVNRISTLTPSPRPNVVGGMLETLFENKAFASAKIDKVYYNPEESSAMKADFTVNTAFNSQNAPLRFSVVVTEDDVQGNNRFYTQNSYVSQNGDTPATITANLGAEWLPYFEPYFGVAEVNYKNIQYSHVARAAYPSYFGEAAPAISQGTAYSGSISFEMPSTVMVKENTNVVLIVTHEASGEILAADEISYDSYTFESGVDKVESASAIHASVAGGVLTVNVEEKADVEVYGADGSLLLKAKAVPGVNTYAAGSSSNLLIVKVTGTASSSTFKLMNK